MDLLVQLCTTRGIELPLPDGLVCLLTHPHHADGLTNREKRRNIYRMLFRSMKRMKTSAKTFIWPNEIKAVIREAWPDVDAGSYDSDVRSNALKVELEDLLAIDWGHCHCK